MAETEILYSRKTIVKVTAHYFLSLQYLPLAVQVPRDSHDKAVGIIKITRRFSHLCQFISKIKQTST